jgi:glycylpeptide N-tetradecanoyltransferase
MFLSQQKSHNSSPAMSQHNHNHEHHEHGPNCSHGSSYADAPVVSMHTFWESQPVPKETDESNLPPGPIEIPQKTIADVRKEEYQLPSTYEWVTVDLTDSKILEEVYTLLTENYVEDTDAMFRFDYSPEFLQWALMSPGYKKEWHLAVRVKSTLKLVAFISAVPASMSFENAPGIKVAEVNYLCIHKKLRAKRLAPVLIKEITRRVNLCNVWQAVYTAGVNIPTPLGQAKYWHRSLQFKKLLDIGFTSVPPNSSVANQIRKHKLPEDPSLGLIPMEKKHVKQVTGLLKTSLTKYKIYPELSSEEVSHWILPRQNVVYSYVKVDAGGKVTDFVSFYSLPSSCLKSEKHSKLMAAYSYYTVANSVSITALTEDALILARNAGFDVYNALEVMENQEFLEALKFGRGDGTLHYYAYNWRLSKKLEPSEIGLVLL